MAVISAKLSTKAFETKDLEIRRLTHTEAIGRPFATELDVVVQGTDGLDPDKVIGAEATLTIDDGKDVVREITGILTALRDHLDTEVDHHNYRLSLRPMQHRLALVETVDIFLDLSIPEVVKKKLDLVGDVDKFKSHLRGDYPARDFVVQYKESDLAFVSRLCEHLGIALVFHDDGSLVLVDDNAGYDTIEGNLGFRSRGERTDVYALDATRSIMPSVYVVRDYNYRTPLTDVQGSHEVAEAYAGGVIEYGAHTKTPEDSARLARVRAEERLAGQYVFSGESILPQIGAARRGMLAGHPKAGDLDLLFTEVVHTFELGTKVSAVEAGNVEYKNAFRAIRGDVAFRPARVTPRPFVPGLLTGVVDADGGPQNVNNIDDQGRYRIRFLFDTAAPGERRASHWVRMAQPHAGAGYGMHFPLNPGIEVLLAFVNGDPDRPVVVGAVPNPATPSPVDSREKRLNRIKTETGVLFEICDGK